MRTSMQFRVVSETSFLACMGLSSTSQGKRPNVILIMTSLYNNRNYLDWGTLNRGEKTFAHLMRDAGYVTGIAGKWQLSGDYKRDGQMVHEAGFDESCMWAYDFDMGPDNATRYRAASGHHHSRYWHPAILKNGENLEELTIDDYGPDVYSNFLLDFIEKHHVSTFFFYYQMTLPHSPFVPTPYSKGVASMNQ